MLTILGKDDVPAIWIKAGCLQFIARKILNWYNYRFYSAQKKMVKDSITAKREGEAGCDGDTPDEKKKRTPRLPEKYCINKKKWIAKVSKAEKTATLAICSRCSQQRCPPDPAVEIEVSFFPRCFLIARYV